MRLLDYLFKENSASSVVRVGEGGTRGNSGDKGAERVHQENIGERENYATLRNILQSTEGQRGGR